MIYLKTEIWVVNSKNQDMGISEEGCFASFWIDLSCITGFYDLGEEKGENKNSISLILKDGDDIGIKHNLDDLIKKWTETKQASVFLH